MARSRPLALAAVAALALVACGPRPDFSKGGTRLTLRAAAGSPADKRELALGMVADRMKRARLAVVTARAGEQLTVDVPSDVDLDRVKSLSTNRGQLTVRDEASTDGPIVIDRVAGARVERDAATRKGTLVLTLRPDDAARVGALSQKLVGKKMGLFLDGAVLTRLLVQTAIPGDRLQIGLPAIHDAATAEAEARSLVALLEGGAFPVAVEIALEEAISAKKK